MSAAILPETTLPSIMISVIDMTFLNNRVVVEFAESDEHGDFKAPEFTHVPVESIMTARECQDAAYDAIKEIAAQRGLEFEY